MDIDEILIQLEKYSSYLTKFHFEETTGREDGDELKGKFEQLQQKIIEIDGINAQAKQLAKHLEELSEKPVDENDPEISSLYEEMRRQEGELKEFEDEKKRIQDELADEISAIESLTSQKTKLEADLRKIKEEKNDLLSEICDLESTGQELDEEIEKNKAITLEIEDIASNIRSLKERGSELHESIRKSREQESILRQETTSSQSLLSEKKSKLRQEREKAKAINKKRMELIQMQKMQQRSNQVPPLRVQTAHSEAPQYPSARDFVKSPTLETAPDSPHSDILLSENSETPRVSDNSKTYSTIKPVPKKAASSSKRANRTKLADIHRKSP